MSTRKFAISVVGNVTKMPFTGDFEVKTILTKRDEFAADQFRRQYIGPSPENTPAPVKLQGDAYMLGQLQVRITSAPKWWANHDNGIDLSDGNVIEEIFSRALGAEAAQRKELADAAEAAVKDLSVPSKD